MKLTIPIRETFISPQGEGILSGLMTLFVRVGGCNFLSHPCKWCDTKYALGTSVSSFDLDTILYNIEVATQKTGVRHICLTGGEPLAHEYTRELIHKISSQWNLSVETNGSLPIWESNAMWSMDMKPPSSGNTKYNLYNNLRLLKLKDQVKVVIADEEDFEFARTKVIPEALHTNIILQPAWKLLTHEKLIDWIKKDTRLCGTVRIGDQMQKRWYPRKRRGV